MTAIFSEHCEALTTTMATTTAKKHTRPMNATLRGVPLCGAWRLRVASSEYEVFVRSMGCALFAMPDPVDASSFSEEGSNG